MSFSSLPDTDELVHALQLQTELKDLTLENLSRDTSCGDTKLINALTIASPEPLILPCLESFTHRHSYAHDYHYKPFLLSRTQLNTSSNALSNPLNVTPLKRAHIIYKKSKTVDLLTDHELSIACAASGTNLVVEYPQPYEKPFGADLGLPDPMKSGTLWDTREVIEDFFGIDEETDVEDDE
ncbi:hypothetical protein AX16_005441 [Volvariella volvacea WC 439]|nr:hypothetical protein AX16_005441 [Volvariella volvacea WC 439]